MQILYSYFNHIQMIKKKESHLAAGIYYHITKSYFRTALSKVHHTYLVFIVWKYKWRPQHSTNKRPACSETVETCSPSSGIVVKFMWFLVQTFLKWIPSPPLTTNTWASEQPESTQTAFLLDKAQPQNALQPLKQMASPLEQIRTVAD